MNVKKYFVVAIVLSGALLAFAVSFSQSKRGGNELRRMALTGPRGEFGPVINTVLPAAESEGPAEMLDLETGQALLQPAHDSDSSADQIVAWIRSNGLDISSSVWSGGAGCVTYDMTIVPVEKKCWDTTTAEELLAHPALSLNRHSPRRLLVLGHNPADTYIFRTGDGTLGMLRIMGLSPGKLGVKIGYKLINPAQSLSAAL